MAPPPQPPHSRHNQTVVDQHTRQATGYAALTRGNTPASPDALVAMLGAGPGDKALDVACGPGSLSLQLAPHVAQATGLDLTPAMLDQARAAQKSGSATNVRWVEGDAAALPFEDRAFDIVASRAAFHHFDAPATVLAEMVRVCKPGGRVAVIDVTPDSDRTAGYDRMEKMRDPSHGHAHSIAELCAMGRAIGLGDPRTETRMSGPMAYSAVLATSFPEAYSREELLAMMRTDAESGHDQLGFRAQVHDDTVLVTYPMTTLVWDRP